MKIRTDYSETFSYARMQNGIPAVRSITLSNDSPEELSDISVDISFDPPFAAPHSLHVSAVEGKKKYVLDNFKIIPSSSFLSNLTERENGSMKISVSSQGQELCSESYPVTLLPYDCWGGLESDAELLASFVVPNHPAVKSILLRASELLARWTSDPSLSGYQSGVPDRARLQMAAIFDAIKEEEIVYSNPPANFCQGGQRIRLPEEILSSRLATCLDSALLYASCLEAIGLHPVLVVKNEHAFAGAWLVDKTSPYPINDDCALLSKSVSDGIDEILLVETTMTNKGSGESFDRACSYAVEELADTDNFLCFLDITSLRNIGIIPLPLRIATAEGYIIEENTKTNPSKPESLTDSDVIDVNSPNKVDKHTIWERKLLDLSLRNNLINLHFKKGIYELMPPDLAQLCSMLENGDSFRVYGAPDGLYSTTPANISEPEADSEIGKKADSQSAASMYAGKEALSHRLHSYLSDLDTVAFMASLRKDARHSLEENGANTLYLSLGTLKWYSEDNDKPHLAPILLVPVEITKATWTLKATGEDICINLTLLEMLRQQFGINIPGLVQLPEKDGDIDVRKVLNTIRRAVMEKKGWDVQNDVVLGLLTFNKFIIWNDIHTNRDLLDSCPMVSSLVDGKLKVADISSDVEDIDEACPSATVLQPISADSSQLRAILDAVHGRSFVMHGPPGTGKSQTITNIIANMLFNGKRVLFVSEKKAALEVVQKRLEEIGLDPFCLEVHSNKAKKTDVLTKLDHTLAVAPQPLSPTFAEEGAKFDSQRREINRHAKALNKVYPAGLSLYDCIARYLSFRSEEPCIRFDDSLLSCLNEASYDELRSSVAEYVTAIRLTGIGPDCRILDLPVEDYTAESKAQLESRLEEVLSSRGLRFWFGSQSLARSLGVISRWSFSSKDIEALREKFSRWKDGLGDMKNYAIYARQRNAVRKMGLGVIAEEFESGKTAGVALEDLFDRSFFKSYAEYIMNREKDTNLFCGEIFESLVSKFRTNDAVFRLSARKELFAKVSNSLLSEKDKIQYADEIAVLKKAIRNTARGISLRTLFSRIPNVLPKLSRCMLMSPLSVSQYLAADNDLFDLVIFDEASQLPTSEAVAAISRGKALIVVGDPKQLPPTSFFEYDSFDEENAEKEDLESILDECIALSLPSVHLRWHYRSHHESLIAFSNANYYDNTLLTFPSCDDMTTRVTLRQIDGLYDRGRSRTNGSEADAIVKEIKKRLENPETKDLSIGVITFNVSQKNLIEEKLDAMLARNKELAKIVNASQDPIFVKSLENVQGDERDVILFSIGYGTDKNGRVSMNFGPLNSPGGWRRLNVAVSRARVEMIIFSSLMPEQMNGNYYIPRGVLDLKAFLKYARDGKEALNIPESSAAKRDLFAELVAEELKENGLDANTAIGSSDFRIDVGVVNPASPGEYLYGILCDGPNYASAESARDKEIIRPQMLEKLGWNIKRKWILERFKG